MKLENASCLITGGTSGIGYCLAQELTRRGARVSICGRDAARLDRALSTLPGATGVVADVAQAEGRQRLVDAAQEQGRLDLLANNAGIQFRGEFTDQTPERIERELNVNLVGPILLAHALLPLLQVSKGKLVNMTSGLGYAPAHDACVYSATKAGLHSFTWALRASAERHQVRVVEVIPPLVATELTVGRDASKMARPESVALAIAEGLVQGKALIAPGIARFVPWLARVAPRFLERKMNEK